MGCGKKRDTQIETSDREFIEDMKNIGFTGGHHTGRWSGQEIEREGWKIVWFGHKHSMWNDTRIHLNTQKLRKRG